MLFTLDTIPVGSSVPGFVLLVMLGLSSEKRKSQRLSTGVDVEEALNPADMDMFHGTSEYAIPSVVDLAIAVEMWADEDWFLTIGDAGHGAIPSVSEPVNIAPFVWIGLVVVVEKDKDTELVMVDSRVNGKSDDDAAF